MIPDTPWARDGACVNHPEPDLWFATTEDGRAGSVHGDVNKAKAVCRNCPVRVDCLEYALAHEQWGIWGETSEAERRRIRRERNKGRRIAA